MKKVVQSTITKTVTDIGVGSVFIFDQPTEEIRN